MLFNCEFRIEIVDKKYKTKCPPIHKFQINYLKTKMPIFFSLSCQGGKGSHVKALEVYTVKALEVYTVKALEVYTVKALEVHTVKALEVHTVKALEVHTVKALEVYTVKALEVSKLFTRGVKYIIPNIGALVNTLYLNIKE